MGDGSGDSAKESGYHEYEDFPEKKKVDFSLKGMNNDENKKVYEHSASGLEISVLKKLYKPGENFPQYTFVFRSSSNQEKTKDAIEHISVFSGNRQSMEPNLSELGQDSVQEFIHENFPQDENGIAISAPISTLDDNQVMIAKIVTRTSTVYVTLHMLDAKEEKLRIVVNNSDVSEVLDFAESLRGNFPEFGIGWEVAVMRQISRLAKEGATVSKVEKALFDFLIIEKRRYLATLKEYSPVSENGIYHSIMQELSDSVGKKYSAQAFLEFIYPHEVKTTFDRNFDEEGNFRSNDTEKLLAEQFLLLLTLDTEKEREVYIKKRVGGRSYSAYQDVWKIVLDQINEFQEEYGRKEKEEYADGIEEKTKRGEIQFDETMGKIPDDLKAQLRVLAAVDEMKRKNRED